MKALLIFRFALILIVLTAALSIYFTLDKRLYYYGESDFQFYNSLPLKLKPVFRNEIDGGFVIDDEHGFHLISQGAFQPVHSDLKINIEKIVEYGFNDIKLVALIKDITGKKYYIECVRNPDNNSRQKLKLNIIDAGSFINQDEYYWTDINNSTVAKFERIRIALILFIALLLFGAVYNVRRIMKSFAPFDEVSSERKKA